MKKSIIVTMIIIVLFLLSIGIGFYYIKNNSEEQVEEYAEIVERDEESDSVAKTIEANTNKVKITPNTKLVLKKYYTKCNHTINSYVELPKELVNLDENGLKKQYSEWEVQKFTEDEVVLLKEEDAFCNEHYILKEKDGRIAIFKVDQSGEEILEEITSISTEYLTQNDLLNIKNGIKVYGIEELNKTLEDYE